MGDGRQELGQFPQGAVGHRPWKLDKYTPRERAELVPNAAYWDAARRPKLERVVLLPLPDPAARTAALLSGQVDWIEAPAPDAIPQLKSRGMVITQNVYPHNWTWHFSRVEGSPWNDIRVRKAANLAVDRVAMTELLGGLMVPAKGMVPPSSPWFGKPKFDIKTDLAEATKLMAEAGYSKAKPLTVKAIISLSGSGQMQPLAMNELIQQNLGEIGIKVDFEVMEWNALLSSWRAGAKDASSRGAHSTNSSYFSQDPFTALIRHLDGGLLPPRGTNWGFYTMPRWTPASPPSATRSTRRSSSRSSRRCMRSSSTTRCSCSSRMMSARGRCRRASRASGRRRTGTRI